MHLDLPCGSDGKESAYKGGGLGWILGGEDALEEGMATHCSVLAWRIPRTEDLAGCKESDMTE